MSLLLINLDIKINKPLTQNKTQYRRIPAPQAIRHVRLFKPLAKNLKTVHEYLYRQPPKMIN